MRSKQKGHASNGQPSNTQPSTAQHSSAHHSTARKAQDHGTLRLWLRLLSSTHLIEQEIRSKLRTEFDSTLPRFDLMSQLQRQPKGLRMGELGKRMLVTGGNITAIVDQLESEGLVARQTCEDDRRAYAIVLTTKGGRSFEHMASAHEAWIEAYFAGLASPQQIELHELLGQLKTHVLHQHNAQEAADFATARHQKTTSTELISRRAA